MAKKTPYLSCSLLLFYLCSAQLAADGASAEEPAAAVNLYKKDKSFTGSVTRDKVRLRLHPTVDAPVVKELARGTYLSVVGELDDFYAVTPPKDTKAYVYRTLILDGAVEGKHVNVRLAPHLEAPIIGQLNTGDHVEGVVSDKNAKWLEIPPPANTLFYVSADYVEKVGDADFFTRHETRKKEVEKLLRETHELGQAELRKPFSEMATQKVLENYEHLIKEYTDFPEEVRRASKYAAEFKDAALHKKVEYLELRTKHPEPAAQKKTAFEPPRTQAPLMEEKPLPAADLYKRWVHDHFAAEIDARMALWIPVEIAYYEDWVRENGAHSIQEFYEEQRGHAQALSGIVEPYDRPVRNKPGDYLLVSKKNRQPIAYIYSTHVNLQNKIGKEITIKAALRPNNSFAYPAYFVIEAE